ncbi:MAG: DUF6476 family protein [Pseudomonadota bacterium]
MDQDPNPADLRGLRNLRMLVSILTGVMIIGMVTIMVLLIGRLRGPATPPIPPVITLPDGTTPVAVTYGPDWYAIATSDDILIYDESGALLHSVPIRPSSPPAP